MAVKFFKSVQSSLWPGGPVNS